MKLLDIKRPDDEFKKNQEFVGSNGFILKVVRQYGPDHYTVKIAWDRTYTPEDYDMSTNDVRETLKDKHAKLKLKEAISFADPDNDPGMNDIMARAHTELSQREKVAAVNMIKVATALKGKPKHIKFQKNGQNNEMVEVNDIPVISHSGKKFSISLKLDYQREQFGLRLPEGIINWKDREFGIIAKHLYKRLGIFHGDGQGKWVTFMPLDSFGRFDDATYKDKIKQIKDLIKLIAERSVS